MSPEREIERLLVAAELDELTSAERDRLNELLRTDDAALDEALAQLELDALLRWHHGSVATAPVRATPRLHRLSTMLAAAALILATTVYFALDRGVDLSPEWVITATGNPDYEIVEPLRVVLRRGELHVRSSVERANELRIDTPSGRADAGGTSFYIGAHEAREEREMMTKLTRVLVLTGSVTLSSSLGSATAHEGGLLVAPQGDPPRAIVAHANTEFGFDLYRQMVASGEHDELFFSPYSIATALAMVAEGARGKTAEEIARVLRLPVGAERVGDDAQRLPLEWSKIHTGFRDLNRLFDESKRVSQVERLTAEIQRLVGIHQEQEAAVERARAGDDRKKVFEARRAAEKTYEEIDRLNRQVKSYQLSIANSIWGERTYELDPNFVEVVSAAYDTGAVVPANFKGDPAGETDRINAWVAERTRNRIQDLLSKDDIDSDTRLVLLNAIWFAGEWTTPFRAELTQEQDFTTLDGSVVQVPMMRARGFKDGRYAAFEADGSFFETPRYGRDPGAKRTPDEGGFTMLELPYRGDDLSMIVLLPMAANGLPALEAKLTADNLARWVGHLQSRKVSLELPKFRAESSIDLEPHLKALGMPMAFDRVRADLTGMSTTTDYEQELFLAKALHKAFVEVHERGTEAAAATAMILKVRGAVEHVPEFHADRPFVYLIRDKRTGTVLFLGRKTGA